MVSIFNCSEMEGILGSTRPLNGVFLLQVLLSTKYFTVKGSILLVKTLV